MNVWNYGKVHTVGKNSNTQNRIHGEFKSKLKSGNVFHDSVQNRLSSSWLSNNIKVKIHGTIILPVVLYGCETWSVILKEERRLRGFESWVLRKICGPKRDEEAGQWKILHSVELYGLYCSSNIIRVLKSRRMRWVGHVACIGDRTFV